MRRTSFLLLLCCLLPMSVSAQTFEWVRTGNASISASGECVLAQQDGSLLAGGTFYNNIELDSQQFFSAGRDIYITKMTAVGRRVWAKRFGGNADDFLFDMKTDHSGNLYLAGAFGFKMTFGHFPLESNGQHDAFVAKLTADGEPIWVQASGGYNSDFGVAVAPDSKGNVYTAGYFHDTMSFGNITIRGWNAGLMTLYLAKYDTQGKCLWAKPLCGSNYQSQYEGVALAVDGSDDLIVTANFHGDALLDAEKLQARGVGDLLVAKFDQKGSLLWYRSAGGPTGVATARSVAIGKKGNILVCGYVTNSVQFAPTTIIESALGFSDAYLACYSADGKFEWVQQGTGRSPKVATSVATDADGNSYITGDFKDTIRFGGATLSGEGKQIFYAASFTPSGEFRWAREAGRGGLLFSKGITANKQGDVYATGTINDTAYFGKQRAMAAISGQDMFIVKLSHESNYSIKKTSETAAEQGISEYSIDKKSGTLRMKFAVVGSHFARIGIFDILGETADSYIEEQLTTGTYEAALDLSKIAHDSYYLRLQLDNDKHTKRIEY